MIEAFEKTRAPADRSTSSARPTGELNARVAADAAVGRPARRRRLGLRPADRCRRSSTRTSSAAGRRPRPTPSRPSSAPTTTSAPTCSTWWRCTAPTSRRRRPGRTWPARDYAAVAVPDPSVAASALGALGLVRRAARLRRGLLPRPPGQRRRAGEDARRRHHRRRPGHLRRRHDHRQLRLRGQGRRLAGGRRVARARARWRSTARSRWPPTAPTPQVAKGFISFVVGEDGQAVLGRVRLLSDPARRRRARPSRTAPRSSPPTGPRSARTRTRSSPSTSRSSAADRCRPAARRPRPRAGAPGRRRWSPLLVGFPCCGSARCCGRRATATSPASSAPPGLGAAVRNTVLPGRRGHRRRRAARHRAGAGPAPTATCRAGRSGGSPSCCRCVVPDFVLGYSWTQAYARGRLHRHRARAALGGPARPGRRLAGPGRRTPPRWSTSSSPVGLAARAEPDLERAARASGAGGPHGAADGHAAGCCCPSVAAAAVLVFVLTLGTFAIPQVLGAPAGFSTVTTRIYADLSIGGDPASFLEAVTLALLLVLVTAVLVAPADALLGPRLRSARPADAQAARARAGTAGRAGARRPPGLAGYLVLTVGAAAGRAGAVLGHPRARACRRRRPTGRSATSGRCSRRAPSRRSAAASAWPSSPRRCSSCSAGSWRCCERRRAGRATATLITLTLVLPGSTLAVALLITYGRWLSGTLALILLAYLAKLWAFAHRPIAGALDRLPAGRAAGRPGQRRRPAHRRPHRRPAAAGPGAARRPGWSASSPRCTR